MCEVCKSGLELCVRVCKVFTTVCKDVQGVEKSI